MGAKYPSSLWSHLSQVPPEIRRSMDAVQKHSSAEGTRLEMAALRAIREERLRSQIPAYVEALHHDCPELPIRGVFRVIELYLGLSYGFIRKQYYESRKEIEEMAS